jgi:hypothetical protein
LADYYIGYQRLMNHWNRLYPGAIHEVAYESLIGAQEATTRELLEACGLPFDEACLRFETNSAATTTASAVQVRSPVYDSSVSLWRHHESALFAGPAATCGCRHRRRLTDSADASDLRAPLAGRCEPEGAEHPF